jgi:hypothetical protein
VAALDGGPGPQPPHSPKLPRGERCAYVVVLDVSDTTHVGDSGLNHATGPILYAINVINESPAFRSLDSRSDTTLPRYPVSSAVPWL